MRYYDVFLAVSQILNTILIAFCDIFGLFHHKPLAKLTKKQTRWNRKRHKLNTQATAEEASSAPTLKTYQMRLICTLIIRTPQYFAVASRSHTTFPNDWLKIEQYTCSNAKYLPWVYLKVYTINSMYFWAFEYCI